MTYSTDTRFFEKVEEEKLEVSEVLALVYEALKEKGYNPVNQIVGYVKTGLQLYVAVRFVFYGIQLFGLFPIFERSGSRMPPRVLPRMTVQMKANAFKDTIPEAAK